ncbi:MAG: hypothetical protein A2096_11885 [Spirochaetes bacterium GWF1_41_5]|nr:MAG: hypothetical protein A2096_11885 [Spirochaetes bacterium GWF1_41_5]HBE02575.1 hypothetical protein [Spirochaetia bacterium]
MDYSTLKYRFANYPAIRIFRSEYAPLILGFFILQFKNKNRLNVPLSEMREALVSYLEDLKNQGVADVFNNTPEGFLDMWCDENHRFLRKYYETGQQDATIELTPETEQAITWVMEMEKREFIGTESRFLRIFELLREISQKSNTNVGERIAELRRRQKEIIHEINTIIKTGVVEIFNETQIKERFYEINDTAYRLISDFREVEQNFKEFVRNLQKERLRDNISKGQLLKYVLDTESEIRESDQGRSFYAFYHFLSSPHRQEELDGLIRTVLDLPEIRRLHKNERLIRQLKHRLIDAGEKIISGNQQLSEQLRRFLDEKILQENRRSALLIAEIKKLAFQSAQNPPREKAFFSLEAGPELNMPMERTLWSPAVLPEINRDINEASGSPDHIANLFNTVYIDRSRLRENIERILSGKEKAALPEVLEQYPARFGLAEILGYMQIAHEDSRHSISESSRYDVCFNIPISDDLQIGENKKSVRRVNIPEVVYYRNDSMKTVC